MTILTTTRRWATISICSLGLVSAFAAPAFAGPPGSPGPMVMVNGIVRPTGGQQFKLPTPTQHEVKLAAELPKIPATQPIKAPSVLATQAVEAKRAEVATVANQTLGSAQNTERLTGKSAPGYRSISTAYVASARVDRKAAAVSLKLGDTPAASRYLARASTSYAKSASLLKASAALQGTGPGAEDYAKGHNTELAAARFAALANKVGQ
jgi:hypothetical protein